VLNPQGRSYPENMLSRRSSRNEEDIHMSKNQKISSFMNGNRVSGEITFRNESDISVTITEPYSGLTGSLHIPYFARPYNSFLTEYGDATAMDLLKKLEQLGSYLDANQKFLALQLALHFYDGDFSNAKSQKRFFDSSFSFLVPLALQSQVVEMLR